MAYPYQMGLSSSELLLCLEPLCSFRTYSVEQLDDHYRIAHGSSAGSFSGSVAGPISYSYLQTTHSTGMASPITYTSAPVAIPVAYQYSQDAGFETTSLTPTTSARSTTCSSSDSLNASYAYADSSHTPNRLSSGGSSRGSHTGSASSGSPPGTAGGPTLSRYPSNNRRFTCEVCKKEYRHKADMVRHAQSHMGPKYDCTYCDQNGARGFYRRDKFLEHQRSVHGINQVQYFHVRST